MRKFFDSNATDFTKERVVYYSIPTLLWLVFFMFLFLASGIYLLFDKQYTYGILFTIVSLYKLIFEYKHLFRINEQQLKINSSGIQIKNGTLYSWNKIKNEQIQSEILDDDTNYYLTFDVVGSKEKIRILINYFNISPKDLDKFVRIHRYNYG